MVRKARFLYTCASLTYVPRFTWVMNSGALAELLHNCPYRFNGIDILADIFFGTALFLFVVCSIIFSARFICFTDAYKEILGNIGDLTFVSCM